MEILSERFAIVTRIDENTRTAWMSFATPIKGEDLLGFSQTMAAMLDGGIPLKRALDTLYGDIENAALRLVIMDLSSQLGSGAPLSKALASHPTVFDKFFVNMVKAGESSGELPVMLNRVADYVEKTEALKDKVKSAMTYPVVVMVFAGLMVALILAFGVPYLRELYDGLGIALPMPTQVAVVIGGFMGDNLTLLIVSTLILAFGLRLVLMSEWGQSLIDQMKLTLPILDELFTLLYTARFSRTLALLYAAGVPLLEALELTGESVGNRLISAAIEKTKAAIQGGRNLSECLRENPYFLDAAIGMVAAGEESGKLERMLNKVADFYEHKFYTKIDGLASSLEPIMMVFVGIAIGGIIIVLGMPFMNLASVF